MAISHPLHSLSAQEILEAAALTRGVCPSEVNVHFKVITLQEPLKKDVLSYLEAEHNETELPRIERKAWVNYYLRSTTSFYEAIVNLSRGVVECNDKLGPNVHGAADVEEILAVEKAVFHDEGVKKELAKFKLPENTIFVGDPWVYGSDGVDDDERMYQVFIYMRDPSNGDEADSNFYAFPLPLSPVVRAKDLRVVRIDVLPTGADDKVAALGEYMPQTAGEYLPEYQTLRTDLKPLQIVQPDGASFTVEEQGGGSVVKWQKWHIRVTFNQREGMVLHDVRYDNRSLFYRLSLSDLSIPYADPRHPFHKKCAFDSGDLGIGLQANNLKLGCDCLGSVYYLSGTVSTDVGTPLLLPNVICIHEQDAGIGWKHTNFRTMRGVVVRNRELILQTIVTVDNYDYILAFSFNQAAELTYEVRATGILSTQPLDDAAVPDPASQISFGTRVHPGVLAVHHQHIFSLRIDPHLDDSAANRLVYSEATALPLDARTNPHGNAYAVHDTPVRTSASLDLAPARNRVFKLQNGGKTNRTSGRPVGYKLLLPATQPLLSQPGSFNARRAAFARHALHAVRFRDGELFAAGQYTNQSRGGAGVEGWVARRDDIWDRDLVVYVQFGLNHVVRAEDFPVMPAESARVVLKPVEFFERNPALDVPPAMERGCVALNSVEKGCGGGR